ncbi:MAG: glutathione S-transferase family protein [Elainella sp.]
MPRLLHGTLASGNVYKVRLLLGLLNLPYEFVPVDLATGAHRSPDFLKLNPMGQVPVLQEGDLVIWDSQAILVYLACQYGTDPAGLDWLPLEPLALTRVMQWLSVSANDIDQSFTALRRHYLLNMPLDANRAEQRAHRLLQVMDTQLQTQDWLAGAQATIADIACFPYLSLAADSRIDLAPYSAVTAWLDRVRALPGFVKL